MRGRSCAAGSDHDTVGSWRWRAGGIAAVTKGLPAATKVHSTESTLLYFLLSA